MNDPLTPDLFAGHRHFDSIEDLRNAEIRRANPIPAVRHTDPETSAAAAALVAPHAQAYRMLVLKTLVALSLTDFELARLIGRQQTSAGKRRGELRDMGLVREARDSLGKIRKRPSPSGAPAIVWEATPQGIQYLREAK